MTAVVMVTDRREVIEKALSAGADEVLLEPIDPNALAAIVDKHFS
jgi:DNA-binding response OmpR family regulator